MRPTIHFVSGLPRSGSTLLVNMLGQNPNHHVTPTNGLITMIDQIRDSWGLIDSFKAQGLENIEPRIAASIRGMSYGFYEKELSAGKIVFDKNRGWLRHIELLSKIYNRKISVICIVRDLRSVIASFEKLYRNNPMQRNQYLGPAYLKAQTIQGRAQVLLSEGGIVGMPINFIRDAMNRGVSEQVIIVNYKDLVSKPKETLSYLHKRLNLPLYDYDPNNIEQITKEDDYVYGWGADLHSIKTKVVMPNYPPWKSILPEHVTQWIDNEFADIQNLAREYGN